MSGIEHEPGCVVEMGYGICNCGAIRELTNLTATQETPATHEG